MQVISLSTQSDGKWPQVADFPKINFYCICTLSESYGPNEWQRHPFSSQLFEVNDLNVLSSEELEKLKLGEVEIGGILGQKVPAQVFLWLM